MFVGIQFVGVLFCGDYLCTVCGPSGRQQWWGACQDAALIRHMASSVSRFHTLVGTRKQHWFNVTIILASLTILSSAIFDLCYPDSYHYPWAWVWWRQWWAWVDIVLAFLTLFVLLPLEWKAPPDRDQNREDEPCLWCDWCKCFSCFLGYLVCNARADRETKGMASERAHGVGTICFLLLVPLFHAVDYFFRIWGTRFGEPCSRYFAVFIFSCIAFFMGVVALVGLRIDRHEHRLYDASEGCGTNHSEIEANFIRGPEEREQVTGDCGCCKHFIHSADDFGFYKQEHLGVLQLERADKETLTNSGEAYVFSGSHGTEWAFKKSGSQCCKKMQFAAESFGITLTTSLNYVIVLEKIYRKTHCTRYHDLKDNSYLILLFSVLLVVSFGFSVSPLFCPNDNVADHGITLRLDGLPADDPDADRNFTASSIHMVTTGSGTGYMPLSPDPGSIQ